MEQPVVRVHYFDQNGQPNSYTLSGGLQLALACQQFPKANQARLTRAVQEGLACYGYTFDKMSLVGSVCLDLDCTEQGEPKPNGTR